ncbi:MAG: AraC family transcriptional regulator [Thermoanaerobaculia bacterium]|nr:AraC family transcriptional regulator [Thermoanaerobaculia bacterium]
MARVPPDSLLAQAARPVRERLRSDGERVDHPGRALFEYFGRHLFDVDLTVKRCCRACRVWKGSALQVVQTEIGTTLGRYLEELRVETAMRLLVLVGGEWPASDAGSLVGYEGEDALRSAFERQTGLTHTVYQKQVRTLAQLGRIARMVGAPELAPGAG